MVRTRAKMDIRMDSVERKLMEVQAEMKEELQSAVNDQRSALENLAATLTASMAALSEQFRSRERSRSPQHHPTRLDNIPINSGGNPNPYHLPPHRIHEDFNRFTVPNGRKIDLPVFTGDNAYNWIVRMERYFRLNRITEEEQVEVAVVAMEGRAINWFIWWEHQTDRRNWDTLKTALIRRFQPDLIQNPYGPMLSLKQLGTVREFRDEFELVIAPQINVDMGILRGIFINGLKEEIKAELKLHNSNSLTEVMDKALLIESRNEAIYLRRKEEDRLSWKEKGPTTSKSQAWFDGFKSKPGNSWPSNTGKTAVDSKSNTTWSNPVGTKITEIHPSGIKRLGPQLSQDEYQERSRKGLCFKCGERWNREHTCKLKNYKLILVEDSEGENEPEEPEVEIQEEEETVMESKSMQLSLMSKEGIPSMRAFKVRGYLNWGQKNQPVEILIDSGASHNFISHRLVDHLSLPYNTISAYKVQIGNGELIHNNGRCEKLNLQLQDTAIQQDFYILELGGTDLVLGMEWLTGLGDVEINFLKQSIKWEEKKQQKIQRDPHLNSLEISLKTLTKILQDAGDGYLMYCVGRQKQSKKIRRMKQYGKKFWLSFLKFVSL
ncbi:unnamed protein product [Cuscuta europaea]|uniref:Retrotransposon gag domain-containing protein n=1 Tax=Cuscuta europaea TaxID=41803 RepID=A0A9P1DWY6_CUSEU|nr:unnamed protein product [Cuscuta europaea]